MSIDQQLISSGLWRWLQGTGLERFELVRAGNGWIFRGTILTQAQNHGMEARYELLCDNAFRTRSAQIAIRDSASERTLHISAEDGRWYENGRENPSVRGALDIDLGWSPSTNTLPIRRLGLQIGQSSGEFTAAWVLFPGLSLEPLPQEYLRISERLYRYSSRGGAFTAQLQVDDQGLVVDYEGFWQRVRTEDQT
jgi:hypothetical protein